MNTGALCRAWPSACLITAPPAWRPPRPSPPPSPSPSPHPSAQLLRYTAARQQRGIDLLAAGLALGGPPDRAGALKALIGRPQLFEMAPETLRANLAAMAALSGGLSPDRMRRLVTATPVVLTIPFDSPAVQVGCLLRALQAACTCGAAQQPRRRPQAWHGRGGALQAPAPHRSGITMASSCAPCLTSCVCGDAFHPPHTSQRKVHACAAVLGVDLAKYWELCAANGCANGAQAARGSWAQWSVTARQRGGCRLRSRPRSLCACKSLAIAALRLRALTKSLCPCPSTLLPPAQASHHIHATVAPGAH